MKKLNKPILFALVTWFFAQAFSLSAQSPTREHRAIWMTPYLSGNWPSAGITTGNATRMKDILDKQLDKFRDQNVNILYYHCRTMCDAMYDSAYEPWSSSVSGTRGVAPAFDPFGYLVESSHERGIEVYAWLNPYRYCGTTKYGDKGGDRNYENSHPDWLISQDKETILNPALEEVKQRIVDVVVDILSKYDVDGIVFDDYFYTSGTPMSLDADQYKKYTSSGGKLSQADWRRANVNEMVARVNKAIKERKPYVTFGIGPAGVASPPNVTSEYGLPAAPGGGDWQYNGIYSDPLAWFKEGSIDYMSPQIYWPSRFEALSEWWANAAIKFGRHCYPSIDLTSSTSANDYCAHVESTRRYSPAGTSGLVYFHYSQFVNAKVGENLVNRGLYAEKALVPLRTWIKSPTPEMVTNVKNDGTTLSWTGNSAGRYAIYCLPKNQTSYQLTLDGISYKTTYKLPADADQYNWFVAAYDRYGNVTPPLAVGATKQTGTAPRLTYPANGEKPVDLFEFKWDHESNLEIYAVEVAEDASFSKIAGVINVYGKSASVAGLPPLTDGKTYYWRVKATDVNREHPVSEIRSFVAPKIAITSPAEAATGISTNATFAWSKAVDNADYTLEIAKNSDMSGNVYTVTTKATSTTVPAKTLTTGTKYYARITASRDEATSASAIITFSTVDKTDYAAPSFVNPKANGQKLHSNESIKIADWEGMTQVSLQLAANDAFAARSSYNYNFSNFETLSPELGTIKLSSKNLEDGVTYYIRVRGAYNITTSSSTQYTDYSPAYTFVYSSQAGVGEVTSDVDTTRIEGNILKLSPEVRTVEIYSVAGVMLCAHAVGEIRELNLSDLENGVYIIRAGHTVLKYIR